MLKVNEGFNTKTDIYHHSKMAEQTVYMCVKRLIRHEFLSVLPSGRKKILSLTEKGQRLIDVLEGLNKIPFGKG
jgi:predicted transcriptional regulator